MAYVVAVDSGGTFSDCVVVTPTGRIYTDKASSTRPDYSVGIVESVRLVAEQLGLSLSDLLAQTAVFAHGTTVVTNTMVTRTGGRVGLLTTRGHEDAILVGRCIQKVVGLSDEEVIRLVQLDKPEPLVPRTRIRGVTERVDCFGNVIVPLNRPLSEELIRSLIADGVDAIAVSLLWSFENPVHEQALGELIRSIAPDLYVTLSSQVAPVIKEYERTVTTVVNAYVAKNTSAYLARLQERLADNGLTRSPVIMQSSGGVTSVEQAWKLPVSLLSSGPAGGVVAARNLGRTLGHPNIITMDMGGTSFDVGLVVANEEQVNEAPVFERFTLLYPMIDVRSIGAGGGSIGWYDAMTGTLKVGPQSAGANPGPACYGNGGKEPTITDANLVLGRIDPNYFLGGRQRLDLAAARAALQPLGDRLDLSVEETALGMIRIMNARMEDLIRKVTIDRGRDPRDFTAYAFGGATGLHIGSMMRGLGIAEAVIPRQAAVFSAFGIGTSDFVTMKQISAPMIAPLDLARLNNLYQTLEAEAAAELQAMGMPPESIRHQRYADVRFRGQVHEVRVPVPGRDLEPADEPLLMSVFEEHYNAKYGQGTAYTDAGLELRTLAVRTEARLGHAQLVAAAVGEADATPAIKGRRPVYFAPGGWTDTVIYDSRPLTPGMQLPGPAILEAPDTTILIESGQRLVIDRYLNAILKQ